jgi:hypothetical protein
VQAMITTQRRGGSAAYVKSHNDALMAATLAVDEARLGKGLTRCWYVFYCAD